MPVLSKLSNWWYSTSPPTEKLSVTMTSTPPPANQPLSEKPVPPIVASAKAAPPVA